MEKVYLHTYKQKDVLAATCAIIAIKFNEEFEPEIQSTIEADNRLSHITKKDILVWPAGDLDY